MPKILVLFAGQPTTLVNAVADGARSVRFSEVELRRIDDVDPASAPDHHQTLGGAEEMMSYDGVVVAASEGGVVPPALRSLLEQAAASASVAVWQNKVGSAFMPTSGEQRADVWPALTTLGDLGMLVIAPSGSGAEAGRQLGARVAQVVGWVTHARSHHHHAH
jgi:hypothetical protein